MNLFTEGVTLGITYELSDIYTMCRKSDDDLV
jgi:hypothetical protein